MTEDRIPSTVLVVDDSPDTLSYINDTLENAGISSLVALEGKQALTISKRLQPDMILLDAIMPGMDGFEVCRALKADPELADIPVIFMTGLSDSENIVKGLEAGGVDYLTKPVNGDELIARMKVHLNNARKASSAQQALDASGQYLLSVNLEGVIQWSTPQSRALLARSVDDHQQWQKQEFAPQLHSWLATNPAVNSVLNVQKTEQPLQVSLLELNHHALLKLLDCKQVNGAQLLQTKLSLTKREAEVLLWTAQGKTNREVAQILTMSPRTVNKHLEQVFTKLEVDNRTAAAGIAIRLLEA